MPRSRTRARIRAAMLAAGLSQPDPERTVGRVRHWYRVVWKRMGYYEDRERSGAGWPSRRDRNRAVREAIQSWLKAALAKEAAVGREG